MGSERARPRLQDPVTSILLLRGTPSGFPSLASLLGVPVFDVVCVDCSLTKCEEVHANHGLKEEYETGQEW